MKGLIDELIKYRLSRAWETLDDARILADKEKWNSAINRLYYSVYYPVTALLLKNSLKPRTHNGVKSIFTKHFIKTGYLSKDFGKIYSQLFVWRQKGDYDDLLDFDKEKIAPYFLPVKAFIETIENKINT